MKLKKKNSGIDEENINKFRINKLKKLKNVI